VVSYDPILADGVVEAQCEGQERPILGELVETAFGNSSRARDRGGVDEVSPDGSHPPDLGVVQDPVVIVQMEPVRERVGVYQHTDPGQQERWDPCR
jgi:hypothetical protein